MISMISNQPFQLKILSAKSEDAGDQTRRHSHGALVYVLFRPIYARQKINVSN